MDVLAVVFANSDLLNAITLGLRDLRDLGRVGEVSTAFLAAARARISDLRVLRWERKLRGRDPSLAKVGLYFHRHVVQTPDGNLCVPDVMNRGLHILTEAGESLRLLKFTFGPPGESLRLVPRGPACDGDSLYAVDASGGRYFRLAWETAIDSPVDSTGNVAGQMNPMRPQVRPAEVGFHDCPSVCLGDASGERLLTPDACSVDASTGTLFIADSGHDRVLVIDAATLQRRSTLGGEPGDGDGRFNRPQGLAARAGLLVVCDSGNSRLQLFGGPDATFVRVVGRHGVAPGCFTEPRGVGLVAHGDGGNGGNGGSLLLVVAESRRLQVLTLRGEPLQMMVPGPSPGVNMFGPRETILRAGQPGPPGLWGVAIGSGDTRAFVVNTVSNELHVLSIHTERLRLPVPPESEE